MRRILVLLLIIIPLFILTPFAHAQDPITSKFGDNKVVTLEEGEVINKDYFITGDIVEIYGTVNGDVYAAGGQVVVDGTVNGDLLVAGGDLRIGGLVTQDVRAAGGQVKFVGDVGRNVTVVGGNVDIAEGTKIEGNLVTGTGNLIVDGTVGGDIKTGSGSFVISGSVGGDVEAGVGQLRITSKGTVGGDLTYWSEEEASISDGSEVGGEVVRNETKAFDKTEIEFDEELAKSAGKAVFSVYKLFSFLAALLVGLLMIKFYPKYMDKVSGNLSKNAGRSFVYGIVLLIGVPIVSVILLITLIGIPISMALMFTYFVYIYLTKLFVSYWFGMTLAKKANKKVSPYLLLTMGLVIFYLITLVPVIGWLISFLSVTIGFGAAALACREAYNSAREKNII